MPDGDDTRYHPRRRIIRVYRDPLEEQRESKITGKSYNTVRSFTEEADKLSQDYVSNYYYDKGY